MIKISCKKELNGAGGKFELDLNLQIGSGEFVALYGKSGSGKTTVLRMLAGFETPDSGEILVKDRTFFNSQKKINLAPQHRNIGFLFQDYALFENMNVKENLLFARKDRALAQKLLDMCELNGLEEAKISRLSGGQKQRVALARSLMREPEILLLDEPLSALDNDMREKLQEYLLVLHKEFGMSVVIVSHDVSEIYKLCGRVFVLENGRAAHNGTPTEIFSRHLGSQKLAISGKILRIKKQDVIFVATVLVGQQICEVVLSEDEAQNLCAGDNVILSAKAFGVNLSKLKRAN